MTTTTTPLAYTVKSLRAHGLECKWSRTRTGAPIIIGRMDGVGAGRWYVIDATMWEDAKRDGILRAFENHCALGAFFSVRA